MATNARSKPQPIFNPPDRRKTNPEEYNQVITIWRVILDIIGLGIILGATLVSYFIAKPVNRGFFCSDRTINYPYKTDTIPTYAAVLISVLLPLLFMWITEIVKASCFAARKENNYKVGIKIWGDKHANVFTIIRNIYTLSVIFAYGYISTWLLTEASKNFVGRLRPHFISVCAPSLNCSQRTSLYDYHTYFQTDVDFSCLSSDSSLTREARRSFMSGHTSCMFYGCLFLIMYLHAAWPSRHLGIFTHILQTGAAVLACYVGYTRISDFHHHWQDVAVGASVGSGIAFTTFRFILNWDCMSERFLPFRVTSSRATSGASMASQNTLV